MLHFFSSSNRVVNSKRAVLECLENALDGEPNLDCDLIVFYATIGHRHGELLAEFKRVAPSAQVVGCTCAGVVGKEGASETMRSLGIMAVKGDPDALAVASFDNIGGANSLEAAAHLSNDLKRANPNVNMVLLMASGIDIAADRAIEGIESVFGPDIPIFGGTSCDNLRAHTSYQFIGRKTLEHGVVAVGFADPTLEVLTQATHGFAVSGDPLTVTKARANRIYELDGGPAWSAFVGRLGLPEGADFTTTIPVGAVAEELSAELHQEYGNQHILRVITKRGADGSMYMPVDCAQGTRLWLTERDEGQIFRGLDRMTGQLVDRLAGRKPLAVFHTDCLARGRALFNRVLKEEILGHMQYPLCKGEPVPWLGMYGFGEFARIGGRNRFHNYTTSLYPILRRPA